MTAAESPASVLRADHQFSSLMALTTYKPKPPGCTVILLSPLDKKKPRTLLCRVFWRYYR
jgi:hypothetical protein